MSKYEKVVLEILSKESIKSTNEIVKELQKKSKKVINWHLVYGILNDLERVNKVERQKAKAGMFWKLR
ncbi:MAG TPA: hypothetical protein VI564_08990 [Candidatus Nanoarchaeia archaeon]|nr:hypothetical protein [Candidatus Nanoarchaeia archaeon]